MEAEQDQQQQAVLFYRTNSCWSPSLTDFCNLERTTLMAATPNRTTIGVGVDHCIETALVSMSRQWRFLPTIRVGDQGNSCWIPNLTEGCNTEVNQPIRVEAISTHQSWGSPLILPSIRVRVNQYIGTALVPTSRQCPPSPIRVGVHLLSFHRSELGLTTTLEQLLFQYRGNFHSSELGFTSYLFTDQS